MIHGGRMFWPLDPRPEDIEIDGIVVPLAHKIRFNGNIMRPYTVGMHTLAGIDECLIRWPGDWLTAFKFFLHDAGEAYGPDIASPLKEADLGALGTSESDILAAIGKRFNVPGEIMTDKVREVDLDCLKTEFNMLMPHTPTDVPGVHSDSIKAFAEDILSEFEGKPWGRAVQCIRRQLFSRFGYLSSMIDGVG